MKPVDVEHIAENLSKIYRCAICSFVDTVLLMQDS